jgi:hypothetical protein
MWDGATTPIYFTGELRVKGKTTELEPKKKRA